MDWFKPLYKSHRRGDSFPVFDTACYTDQAEYEHFILKKNRVLGPKKAYQAYNLQPPENCNVWTTDQLPGLQIITNAITPQLQCQLVKESVTDYLADPEYLTNLDAHHDLPRPIDLFDEREISPTIKNEKIRKSGLRWVTLGGQYNWTTKVYPTFEVGSPGCPLFPRQLGQFVETAFNVTPQAAIVNYYREGDILSPHQDVAEISQQDLVSISLGCDCIFYAGAARLDVKPLAVLLHSGDVIIMGGESRQAWHGVGRVFNGTAPEYLQHCIDNEQFSEWICGKRININIRQMID